LPGESCADLRPVPDTLDTAYHAVIIQTQDVYAFRSCHGAADGVGGHPPVTGNRRTGGKNSKHLDLNRRGARAQTLAPLVTDVVAAVTDGTADRILQAIGSKTRRDLLRLKRSDGCEVALERRLRGSRLHTAAPFPIAGS
jgi:hypothetical protein